MRWFLFVIKQIESNVSSFSPGRFDQYILPYLDHDLESGRKARHRMTSFVCNSGADEVPNSGKRRSNRRFHLHIWDKINTYLRYSTYVLALRICRLRVRIAPGAPSVSVFEIKPHIT
ncbi:MAG: pyruvate formate lyase family protein [Anaerolineaceae bacterium]